MTAMPVLMCSRLAHRPVLMLYDFEGRVKAQSNATCCLPTAWGNQHRDAAQEIVHYAYGSVEIDYLQKRHAILGTITQQQADIVMCTEGLWHNLLQPSCFGQPALQLQDAQNSRQIQVERAS